MGLSRAPHSQQPAELTSQRKGFSPECCSEWTFSDILRLKDFPQVSQVKGMSLVWAAGGHQTSLLRGTYLNPHLQACLLAAPHPMFSWRVILTSIAHPGSGPATLKANEPGDSPPSLKKKHQPGYPACSWPTPGSQGPHPMQFTLSSGGREVCLPRTVCLSGPLRPGAWSPVE